MATKSLPLVLLLVVGGCSPRSDAPAGDLAAATEGLAYQHRLAQSRFDVGEGEHEETDGPVVRVTGARGSFATDRVTGAVLAVRTAMRPDQYPEPLSQSAEEHSRVASDYLVRSGVPTSEVSGTHVTTTMAGGMSRDGKLAPWSQRLLWYSTHLERSVGGVPVEGSFAFAALDTSGAAITEGVYWPSIPADVVARAQELSRRLGSPDTRASFFEPVLKAHPEIDKAAGTVKIVHTSAGYPGRFEVQAVYSVIVRNPNRGKAKTLRFDGSGARVVLGDERATGADSPKTR